MTNETMLALRDFVSLRVTKQNPLAQWTDAFWRYDFRVIDNTCLSVWTAFIKYDENIFSLKALDSYRWIPTPTSFHLQLHPKCATLERWSLSENDLSFLSGSTPLTLPHDNPATGPIDQGVIDLSEGEFLGEHTLSNNEE